MMIGALAPSMVTETVGRGDQILQNQARSFEVQQRESGGMRTFKPLPKSETLFEPPIAGKTVPRKKKKWERETHCFRIEDDRGKIVNMEIFVDQAGGPAECMARVS
ncbi:hypothetical protein SAY86_007226 [Trapa natans]|uniref:Uncharacterized protein n=1 Tax=Trapa natans TaxID=22666 RepID=A0AAN7QXN0_TRANT|nr:hypothetical protein SAY86_007226 [Trapa natans]